MPRQRRLGLRGEARRADHQRDAALGAGGGVLQRRARRREVDHHVGGPGQRALDRAGDGDLERPRAGDDARVEADLRALRLLERAHDDEVLLAAQRVQDPRAHLPAHPRHHGADLLHERPPYSRIACSTLAAPASETGTSGSRSSGAMRPMRQSACFTGSGLVSQNIAFTSGAKRVCAARARARSPAKNASTMPERSPGAMFPTTLITPCPPIAMVASANMSSPARMTKLAGTPAAKISATRGATPLAAC